MIRCRSKKADAVIMESTYGDRNHRSLHETAIEGREIIARAIENKAKILVPVFAVGRTQLLLYLLAGAFQPKDTSHVFRSIWIVRWRSRRPRSTEETMNSSMRKHERWWSQAN